MITAQSPPITAKGFVLQRRSVPITAQDPSITTKSGDIYFSEGLNIAANGHPYHSEGPQYYNEGTRRHVQLGRM